jgi:hypothetical protein
MSWMVALDFTNSMLRSTWLPSARLRGVPSFSNTRLWPPSSVALAQPLAKLHLPVTR